MGTVTVDYDDGVSCEIGLTFTGTGSGMFSYGCSDGSQGEGSFRLTTGSLFVPVILSSAGRNQSFFTSELTLANRGDRDVKLDYSYTANRGGGSGTTSEVLPAGSQRVEPDALDYLRRLGILIPETGNRIGTLRVEVPMGSEVGVVVRTTTVVPDGRAGLAYPGIPEEEGFTEAVYLCGLRQNGQDRSNVAFQNMGVPEEGLITLRTTVYSGEAGDAGPRVLEDRTLEPGGFYQYSGLLGVLEIVDGDRQGYVKVERVEGEAPLLRLRGDQRPGQLGRVVRLSGDGQFTGGDNGADPAGGGGDQRVPERADGDELLTGGGGRSISASRPDTVRTPDRAAEFTLMPVRLEGGEQRILPDLIESLRPGGSGGAGGRRGASMRGRCS